MENEIRWQHYRNQEYAILILRSNLKIHYFLGEIRKLNNNKFRYYIYQHDFYFTDIGQVICYYKRTHKGISSDFNLTVKVIEQFHKRCLSMLR